MAPAGYTAAFSYDETVLWTLTWIGIGTAPDHVYVKVSTTSRIQSNVNLGGVVTDGLQNTSVGPMYDTDSVYQRVQLSGGTGTTKVEITGDVVGNSPTSAVSIWGGPQSSIVVAGRAAKLFASVDPTYTESFLNSQTPIAVLNDPTATNPTNGDTVVNLAGDLVFNTETGDYEFPDGTFSGSFNCELWGSCPLLSGFPFYTYSISGGLSPSIFTADGQSGTTVGTTYSALSIQDQLSRLDVGNLVMNGPHIYTLECQVADPSGSGETINVSYKMHAHAPLEQPKSPIMSAAYIPSAPLVNGPDFDNTNGTNSMACHFNITTTQTVTTTISADASVTLWKVVTGKVGIQRATTGSFSVTSGGSATVPIGLYGWWQVNRWLQDYTIQATSYGQNGYIGPSAAHGTIPWTTNNNEFVLQFKTSKTAPPPGN